MKFLFFLLLACFLFWQFCGSSLTDSTHEVAYVTASQVKLRAQPDLEADIIRVLSFGDSVYVLSQSSEKTVIQTGKKTLSFHWFYVDDRAGRLGWVYGAYLNRQLPVAQATVPLPPPPPLFVPAATAVPNDWGAIQATLREKWIDLTGNEADRRLADLSKKGNATEPLVRQAAIDMAKRNNCAGNFNLGQVCNIFDAVVGRWHYINDPAAQDYSAAPTETIQNGYSGDCDDAALVLCALIHCIGGETRISNMQYNDKSHAFTEVNLGPEADLDTIIAYLKARYRLSDEQFFYRLDEEGNYWLNLDWQENPHHPGGAYFYANREIIYFPLRGYYRGYQQ